METNNNVDIPAEELLSLLKQQIDFLESQMAERCGMKLYKSANGFTQKEIYANKFPFIQEYSYYKITDSEYEPDYKKNDYVFVQKTFDVKEEDNSYVLEMELPGCCEKDVSIELDRKKIS